jgi:hypothetical protein
MPLEGGSKISPYSKQVQEDHDRGLGAKVRLPPETSLRTSARRKWSAAWPGMTLAAHSRSSGVRRPRSLAAFPRSSRLKRLRHGAPMTVSGPSATWLDFAYRLRARPRAGSRPLPSVTPTRHVVERASLFRLDVGELDHLGPRSSATQIGKSSLCRFPASPKYDRYGFR